MADEGIARRDRGLIGRSGLSILLIVSISLAALSGAYIYLNRPIIFTVAVGPPDGQLVSYVKSLAQALVASRESFRLRIVQSAGSSESSALLDGGKVDLAMLRSDDDTSQTARAVVVVHRKVLLFVARVQPEADLLKTIQNGKGGVLRTFDTSFIRLLSQLYEHYGLSSSAPFVEMTSADEAVKALKGGTLDYLVALVHPSDRNFQKLMVTLNADEAVSFEIKGPPAAPGAAAQLRALESSEVIEGLFGGAPPLPRKPISTVAVTYELATSSDQSERSIARLTKTLLDLSATLRGADDGGLRIEAPTLDQPRRYQPHAGTAKQLSGDAETFLEEYSDMIWMIIFGAGFLGSTVSASLTIMRARRLRSSRPAIWLRK